MQLKGKVKKAKGRPGRPPFIVKWEKGDFWKVISFQDYHLEFGILEIYSLTPNSHDFGKTVCPGGPRLGPHVENHSCLGWPYCTQSGGVSDPQGLYPYNYEFE